LRPILRSLSSAPRCWRPLSSTLGCGNQQRTSTTAEYKFIAPVTSCGNEASGHAYPAWSVWSACMVGICQTQPVPRGRRATHHVRERPIAASAHWQPGAGMHFTNSRSRWRSEFGFPPPAPGPRQLLFLSRQSHNVPGALSWRAGSGKVMSAAASRTRCCSPAVRWQWAVTSTKAPATLCLSRRYVQQPYALSGRSPRRRHVYCRNAT
jgi:hypothetical protein